jgi:hypothetical protein
MDRVTNARDFKVCPPNPADTPELDSDRVRAPWSAASHADEHARHDQRGRGDRQRDRAADWHGHAGFEAATRGVNPSRAQLLFPCSNLGRI